MNAVYVVLPTMKCCSHMQRLWLLVGYLAAAFVVFVLLVLPLLLQLLLFGSCSLSLIGQMNELKMLAIVMLYNGRHTHTHTTIHKSHIKRSFKWQPHKSMNFIYANLCKLLGCMFCVRIIFPHVHLTDNNIVKWEYEKSDSKAKKMPFKRLVRDLNSIKTKQNSMHK